MCIEARFAVGYPSFLLCTTVNPDLIKQPASYNSRVLHLCRQEQVPFMHAPYTVCKCGNFFSKNVLSTVLL